MATTEYSLDRGLPSSVDAERSILGAILLDNFAYHQATSQNLQAEDFSLDSHRRIYGRMRDLGDQGHAIDLITLADELGRNKEVEAVGGVAYLSSLTDGLPHRPNIEQYVRIVKDKALLRGVIFASNAAIAKAMDEQDAAGDVLSAAEAALYQLSDQRFSAGFQSVQQIVQSSFGSIDALYERGQRITGLETHFKDLDDLTSGFQKADLIIIAARPSMGKAQPLDARVKTPDGWKQMGDLRVGDALASVDGKESLVTGVFPQGLKRIFRVTFSDGRSAECCDEHLWRVFHRQWPEPRILSLARIRRLLQSKRNVGRLWIETVSGDFGSTAPLPIDPWVLGSVLGDGCIKGSSVRFSSADSEMVTALSRKLTSQDVQHTDRCNYRIVTRGGSHRRGVQGVVPNALKDSLVALQLWNLGAEEKFIPAMYLSASREQRLDLLRGLLDTDGWVEKWGTLRYCTSSPRLARDVRELVRSLGGLCSVSSKRPVYTYRGELRKGRPSFVINIQHSDPASLVSLARKRKSIVARQRLKRLTITSIEPSREFPAQCISVSHPGRLYITDDYVVTHNTAFAMNIAENAAVEDGKVVGVFSLEMSASSLLLRMLCSCSRVDSHKMRTGFLAKEDYNKLTEGLGKLAEAPLFIDDTPGISLTEMRAKARRLQHQQGRLDLLVVDYLQLMSAGGTKRQENRTQEVSAISRGLKMIAKELNVPLIALSQLSRAPENRGGKDTEPKLSDLRESGSIEQDADVVAFIYRPEYYDRDNPDVQNKAKLLIAKQRNGPTDTIQLFFAKQYTRFETLDRSDWMQG